MEYTSNRLNSYRKHHEACNIRQEQYFKSVNQKSQMENSKLYQIYSENVDHKKSLQISAHGISGITPSLTPNEKTSQSYINSNTNAQNVFHDKVVDKTSNNTPLKLNNEKMPFNNTNSNNMHYEYPYNNVNNPQINGNNVQYYNSASNSVLVGDKNVPYSSFHHSSAPMVMMTSAKKTILGETISYNNNVNSKFNKNYPITGQQNQSNQYCVNKPSTDPYQTYMASVNSNKNYQQYDHGYVANNSSGNITFLESNHPKNLYNNTTVSTQYQNQPIQSFYESPNKTNMGKMGHLELHSSSNIDLYTNNPNNLYNNSMTTPSSLPYNSFKNGSCFTSKPNGVVYQSSAQHLVNFTPNNYNNNHNISVVSCAKNGLWTDNSVQNTSSLPNYVKSSPYEYNLNQNLPYEYQGRPQLSHQRTYPPLMGKSEMVPKTGSFMGGFYCHSSTSYSGNKSTPSNFYTQNMHNANNSHHPNHHNFLNSNKSSMHLYTTTTSTVLSNCSKIDMVQNTNSDDTHLKGFIPNTQTNTNGNTIATTEAKTSTRRKYRQLLKNQKLGDLGSTTSLKSLTSNKKRKYNTHSNLNSMISTPLSTSINTSLANFNECNNVYRSSTVNDLPPILPNQINLKRRKVSPITPNSSARAAHQNILHSMLDQPNIFISNDGRSMLQNNHSLNYTVPGNNCHVRNTNQNGQFNGSISSTMQGLCTPSNTQSVNSSAGTCNYGNNVSLSNNNTNSNNIQAFLDTYQITQDLISSEDVFQDILGVSIGNPINPSMETYSSTASESYLKKLNTKSIPRAENLNTSTSSNASWVNHKASQQILSLHNQFASTPSPYNCALNAHHKGGGLKKQNFGTTDTLLEENHLVKMDMLVRNGVSSLATTTITSPHTTMETKLNTANYYNHMQKLEHRPNVDYTIHNTNYSHIPNTTVRTKDAFFNSKLGTYETDGTRPSMEKLDGNQTILHRSKKNHNGVKENGQNFHPKVNNVNKSNEWISSTLDPTSNPVSSHSKERTKTDISKFADDLEALFSGGDDIIDQVYASVNHTQKASLGLSANASNYNMNNFKNQNDNYDASNGIYNDKSFIPQNKDKIYCPEKSLGSISSYNKVIVSDSQNMSSQINSVSSSFTSGIGSAGSTTSTDEINVATSNHNSLTSKNNVPFSHSTHQTFNSNNNHLLNTSTCEEDYNIYNDFAATADFFSA